MRKVYLVAPTVENSCETCDEIIVFADRADAEEMILALVEEDSYESWFYEFHENLPWLTDIQGLDRDWEDDFSDSIVGIFDGISYYHYDNYILVEKEVM
jgi:hypothetical protein